MHSFEARTAASSYTAGIHPALTSFADEVCGTAALFRATCGGGATPNFPIGLTESPIKTALMQKSDSRLLVEQESLMQPSTLWLPLTFASKPFQI